MNENHQKNEISLEQLWLFIRQSFKAVLKKKVYIMLIAVVFGILGFWDAYRTKPVYEAKTSFVLSGESKSGGLMGLAGQFGVDVGGGDNNVFSGENILLLFKSQLLIKRTLFENMFDSLSGGNNTTMVNYYVRMEALPEKWSSKPGLLNVFPFPANPAKLSPVQDSLIREVIEKIKQENLSITKPDKKASFYEVKTVSTDERFSANMTDKLVKATTLFYIETKTQSSRKNLEMLQKEADSLRALLTNSIVSTSQAADNTFNLNQAYQVQRSGVQQGQIRSNILSAAYAEVLKNVEMAKFTLMKETPLLQIIDTSEGNLKRQAKSKTRTAIIWAFFAGLISAIFFFVSFYIKKQVNTKSRIDA